MNPIGLITSPKTKTKKQNTLVKETFTHSCAIGQTGCGKTTGYIYPNIKKRIQSKHSLLVYDYKGKEHLAIKALAKEQGRLEDVVEIGKPWGAKINLIKYMNTGELENFIDDFLQLQGDNQFWGNAAISFISSILSVQRQQELFVQELRDLHVEDECSKILAYKREFFGTIKGLYGIVHSKESIKTFLDEIDSFQKDAAKALKRLLLDAFEDETEVHELKKKYTNLLSLYKNLKDTILHAQKVLDTFKNVPRDQRSISTHIQSMSPLAILANMDFLNEDAADILELLNTNKIVIVHTHSMSDDSLAHFTKNVLLKLSQRTHQKHIQPVSVFIDEAQRVVGRSSDLPIDVMREAKVELFLAFQNINLMVERMGELRFFALYKNLTTRFLFANKEDYLNYDTSSLKTHEYYVEGETLEASRTRPIYLKEHGKFTAEMNYQKHLNLHERYRIDESYKEHILLYDSNTSLDGMQLLQDIDGNLERIKVVDQSTHQWIESYFESLHVKQHKFSRDDADRFDEHDEISEEDDLSELLEAFKRKLRS